MKYYRSGVPTRGRRRGCQSRRFLGHWRPRSDSRPIATLSALRRRRSLGSNIELWRHPENLAGAPERPLLSRHGTAKSECPIWPRTRRLSPQQRGFRATSQVVWFRPQGRPCGRLGVGAISFPPCAPCAPCAPCVTRKANVSMHGSPLCLDLRSGKRNRVRDPAIWSWHPI